MSLYMKLQCEFYRICFLLPRFGGGGGGGGREVGVWVFGSCNF